MKCQLLVAQLTVLLEEPAAQHRFRRLVQHYRELIKITRATLTYVEQAATKLWQVPDLMMVALWQAELCHYRPLIERIIWQTERRVLCGEALPAGEKIISLFEPHADIIVKGSRDIEYGHKLNLTTGRSGLILVVVFESGNPADSERLLPMLERHIGFYGEAPRQAAADGAFANRHNLSQAKAYGVRDMAFHKKAGPRIDVISTISRGEKSFCASAKVASETLIRLTHSSQGRIVRARTP